MGKLNKYPPSRLSRGAKKQSFWRQFFSSQRLLALIFLLVLIAVSIPLLKTATQNRAIDKEIAALKEQNEAYLSKSAELKELVDYLQSDESLEERARLNQGLKKPNETVVVVNIPDTPSKNNEVVVADTRTANWNRWLAYFFH
ncbi:MAG: FtsB family cell division protein [Patescibacteria group bacterium]|jgi:cell division protein FtsB